MAVFREPAADAVSAAGMRAEENPFAGLRPGRWYRVSWAGQNRSGHSESYPAMGNLEWLHPRGRFAVFRTRAGYAFTVHRGHLAAGAQILPALVPGGKAAGPV